MITKKQARIFRERTSRGERPPIPEEIAWLLGTTGAEMKKAIERARIFEYGTKTKCYSRRFVEMGIMDENLEYTALGREYLAANKAPS